MKSGIAQLCIGAGVLAMTGAAGWGLCGACAQPTPTLAAHKIAAVGEPAPGFTLRDTQGKEHTLAEYTKQGTIVVLEWFNSDCPWIQRHHTEVGMLEKTQQEFKDHVVWLAINSSAAGDPSAGAQYNEDARRKFEMAYPVLLDPTGTVGRRYGAKTTPHMYVIDAKGILRYKGAADNYRDVREFGQINYTKNAITAILAGETVDVTQTRPYGCAVKYGED